MVSETPTTKESCRYAEGPGRGEGHPQRVCVLWRGYSAVVGGATIDQIGDRPRSDRTTIPTLWHPSANSEETVDDHPFRFDIGRTPNPTWRSAADDPISAWGQSGLAPDGHFVRGIIGPHGQEPRNASQLCADQ
jgi:hypothetical protein